jgi:hypothetical protein
VKEIRGKLSTILLAGIVLTGLTIIGCVQKQEEQESDPHIGDIRLTEIQYHPDDFNGIDNDSLEFIELKNTGTETVNLGALRCTTGVTYNFPKDAKIAAGGFYVIASNKSCFLKRYAVNPDGVYSGQLSNSGEKIAMYDLASKEIVLSLTYSDNGSWPEEADGAGYSLVPVNPNPGKDETAPSFWRGSSAIGGSPGSDDGNKTLDSALLNLRITEIMYHPDYTDSTSGDSLEFIELRNTGSTTLTLTGVIVASGVDYGFPAGSTLLPGAYCVLASNASWFKTRYGFKPFDEYKGQLRNSGDTITIKEIKSGTTLLTIVYTDQYPWSLYADGNGWSLVTKNPVPAASDENNPASWRHSLRLKGSPGRFDPEPVYVNEVLPHTDPPLTDAVELYNPGDSAVDLGNWWISDDPGHPMKFRIPAGTVINAHGYVVFDEHDFNADPLLPTSFRFSEYGEAVYLFADSIGKKGWYHGFTFGAIENGVTVGRYFTNSGVEEFVPQTQPSLGAANKGPRVGPVVITEIMRHPSDSSGAFIEIRNIGASAVPLFDETDTTRPWKIAPQGILFPSGAALKAGEVALVIPAGVPVDSMRKKHSLPDSIQLFAAADSLFRAFDSIAIMKPDVDSVSLTMTELPYFTIDRIVIDAAGSWPSDGAGTSLQRVDPAAYANDPKNWKAAEPTAGK